MPTKSRENKVLINIVVVISIALVIAWLMAINYIKTHFHYTGKGSRGTDGENIFYSLALLLALAELAFLRLRDSTTRNLLYAAAFLNIALYGCFTFLLIWVGNEANTDAAPFEINLSLLDWLDIFPLFCDILLFIIFIIFRKNEQGTIGY